MSEIVFVMPVYNESQIIANFLEELNIAFSDIPKEFIVVNDLSKDDTAKVLGSLSAKLNIEVINNETNLGHGRSLLRGLNRALVKKSTFVIAVDGDGHFLGTDIRKLYNLFTDIQEKLMIIEGCRQNRLEPKYRKVTSLMTRLLVWSRCGKFPKDANTPLRFYKTEALVQLLNATPNESVIPNLHFSSATRKLKMPIRQVPIDWFNRKGNMELGTTWGTSKTNLLPSKRFVKFCLSAFSEWIYVKK